MLPNVLLLKISPHMQSWGVGDKFVESRKTNRFPTKSGVIGLIASALGWDRDHDLTDLNKLRMGVRIDSPGDMAYDYQTTKMFEDKASKLSHRWYLTDAVFLVALEGDDLEFLNDIAWALDHPAFNIFAGRKAFPLNPDLVQSVTEDSTIEEVFDSTPWMGVEFDKPDKLEVLIDAKGDEDNLLTLTDLPVSFDYDSREWADRTIARSWVDLKKDEESFSSDAMDMLRLGDVLGMGLETSGDEVVSPGAPVTVEEDVQEEEVDW